jgi:UDP-3-O-[3-hydroxymyristoyl] glucosamine N-acyltransferase
MAGSSGLAGSVTLGDGVIIGRKCFYKDHTTIGDGAMCRCGSGVTGDIPAGKPCWAILQLKLEML